MTPAADTAVNTVSPIQIAGLERRRIGARQLALPRDQEEGR